MRLPASAALLLLAAASASAAPVPLVNPGFESMRPGIEGHPEGWTGIQHAGEESYDFALDSGQRRSGTQSMRIKRIGPEPYGSIMQVVDGTPLAGRTVRLSAWMRSEAVAEKGGGGAALTLTAMRGSSIIAYEFMKRSRVRGTRDWTRVSIDLALPARTTRVELGAMLEGDGTLWVDDFGLEVLDP